MDDTGKRINIILPEIAEDWFAVDPTSWQQLEASDQRRSTRR